MGGKVAKPTYEQIKDYVQKTHGMKVSSLYVAQMKAECGLETQADRSGDKKQPKRPRENAAVGTESLARGGLHLHGDRVGARSTAVTCRPDRAIRASERGQ